MADTIPVQYVGPFDQVEVATTGLIVQQGEVVDLYPTLAGRPPHGEPDDEDYDPGAGLLAQVDTWQVAAGGTRKVLDGPPAGNASRDAWVAFYATEGVAADDIADLGRDELIELYELTTLAKEV